MLQRRAKRYVPGGGDEAVAVALAEIAPALRDVAVDRLFQYLRLPPFVEDLGQQPEIVPFAAGMRGQGQEVSADQRRLVAFAPGLPVVGAVPLQRAPTQVLAALAVGEAAGVVVVLQVRLLRVERRAMGGLHLQRGLLEVVVAPADPAGTGVEAHAEALDHRLVGDQPGVLHIGDGALQPRKGGLVVAEDQHMALGRKLMVVMDALLLAEPAEERQVGFVILGAVLARRIHRRAELEAVGVGEDTVAFQHLGDDLRHAEVLEYPLVAAQSQVGEARHERHLVACQALARIALGDAEYLPVDAAPCRRQREECRLVQQRVEVEVGSFADQFQVEAVWLADGFAAGEGEHLQVVPKVLDTKTEVRLVSGSEHSLSSVKRVPAFLGGRSLEYGGLVPARVK